MQANFRQFYLCRMPLAATQVNLHATGGHSGAICMQLVSSCMHFLPALAARTMQSRQFFESTLLEQLFELKNEDAIKKFENLGDTSP